MTLRSALQHARRLSAGDRKAWLYLPYQLKMKCRGLDLGWQGVRDSGLSEERSHWHSNSGGPDLDALLKHLPILRADTALDIGCGKGGAILTLAQYPFGRVDGVEISPDLARIARRNLSRMRITNSTIFCSDAAEFTDLDAYNHFYMYNPFPDVVMQAVMNNIRSSLARRQRRATLIYKNPVFEPTVLASGFRKVSETRRIHPDYPPFSVYVATELSPRRKSA